SVANGNPTMAWICGILTCLTLGPIDRAHRRYLRLELLPRKAQRESLPATVATNERREAPPSTRDPHPATSKVRGPPVRAGLALAAVCSLILSGSFILTMFLPGVDPRPPDFEDISAFGASDVVQIDRWLLEQVTRSRYPSLSVAIVRDGETV